jgi:hypothetical protein
MLWKSYRAHGDNTVQSPFAAVVAALCIALVFAAPWILLAIAAISVWRWLFG